MNPEYVVSGCLAGLPCRYDGGSNPCKEAVALVQAAKAIAVCPESLSGLPSPREPCEQRAGRVFSRDGRDVTEAFERGAELALRQALASGAKKALLKSKSPSCGVGMIYDGSFSKKPAPGNGIFAQKLLDAGFEVWTEADLQKPMAHKQAASREK